MQIVFFSNFINHHQILLAKELYKLTEGNYYFVEVKEIPQWLIDSGYPNYSSESFVIRAWKSEELYRKAKDLAVCADVAIFAGPDVLDFEIIRAKNTNKITFDVSERWLKKGLVNALSPRFIKAVWYYHTLFFKKPVYKLCSSAFCASDLYRFRCFKDKCYKWGYFTKVNDKYPSRPERSIQDKHLSIMWCSRFLKWKHPELPVRLAKYLSDNGYSFHLDMFGGGVQYEKTLKLANKLGLNDKISFRGNVANEVILMEMRSHDVFLLTSDRNEGWGTVTNEAMSNGCVVVCSNKVGSVPFLVKDRENGLVFNVSSFSSLIDTFKWLYANESFMGSMSNKAYLTMKNEWSAPVAASNLLLLINDLNDGRETSIEDGPCSVALPIM